MDNLYHFSVNTLKGESIQLQHFANKVLLIVNVASLCGFTPQYKALENLYRRYQSQGFEILAFPCNQFGQQEPGDAATIQSFCETHYDITFPLFEKIDVNGSSTHPLYHYLKKSARGIFYTQMIKWNFTKFLINRQGQVVKRFAPFTPPHHLEASIEKLL